MRTPMKVVALVAAVALMAYVLKGGIDRRDQHYAWADANAQWVVEAIDCKVTATLRGRQVTGVELDPSCIERAAGVGLLGLPAGPGRVSPMAQEGCTELPYALGARPRCSVRPRK